MADNIDVVLYPTARSYCVGEFKWWMTEKHGKVGYWYRRRYWKRTNHGLHLARRAMRSLSFAEGTNVERRETASVPE